MTHAPSEAASVSDDDEGAIRLERVTKRFRGSSEPAVEALDLTVPAGELVVLVGPSGCGKTTTLKMINRIVEPSSGRITIGGRDATKLPVHELRRDIGYVIQQVGLFPHRTIAHNIGTVPRLLGWDRRAIDARVDELLARMDLDPKLASRYPSELSGGQRQRVGVARALAADPPVLLMDEPYGAVDPLVRGRLQQQLLDLQAELAKTIVFVTHDIDEAVRLGDRIAILATGGRLAQYATPDELLRAPASAFVEDFLGDERGLKRLALVAARDADLRDGPVVDAAAAPADVREVAARERTDWVGVLDGARLRGWLWVDELVAGRPLGDHQVRDFEVWVAADATLRGAIDAIVASPNRVAVVFDGDRYLGMLDVDRVAAELRR